jgi:hypothetical protein
MHKNETKTKRWYTFERIENEIVTDRYIRSIIIQWYTQTTEQHHIIIGSLVVYDSVKNIQ